MVARTQKEIRQRAPLWLAGLLVLNAALMTFQARHNLARQNWFTFGVQTFAALVQRPTATVSNGGADFLHHIRELRQADTENQELKKRVADMDAELRELRVASAENERLKNLLDLKQQSKIQMLAARVIARDPSAWFNTVIINRGRTGGVQVGMPVVTKDGIVGRIIGTSLLTAQVMLLTDEKAAAGAVAGQLGSSNAIGSIRGMGNNGLLELQHVSGVESVKPGDHVLTTGQDGIYPPGFNVGDVIEVKGGTATTTQTIYVKPSARIAGLDEVAVLLYRAPERGTPDQTLTSPTPNTKKK
ncbi:MAG: rod shape-determining protein MreC [Pyrinomonadaceae bacterium]